jgi:hypothetical protein
MAMAASKKREKPIPVTTDNAFRTNITQLVTATGKIQPEVEVKITPEVSGEIKSSPTATAHRSSSLSCACDTFFPWNIRAKARNTSPFESRVRRKISLAKFATLRVTCESPMF